MIADLLRKMIERDEARLIAARRLLELVDGDPLAELDDTDPTPAGGVARPVLVDQDDEHVCDRCHRSFKSAAGLGRHRTTVCADDASPAPVRHPVFECTDCEYGVDEASKMIRHTLAAHGRRPLDVERTPAVSA